MSDLALGVTNEAVKKASGRSWDEWKARLDSLGAAKDDRTVIAFHHDKLPGSAERAERRAHFTATLDALEAMARNA